MSGSAVAIVNNTGSGTTLVLSGALTGGSASCGVLDIGWYLNGSSILSIVDSLGNTWTLQQAAISYATDPAFKAARYKCERPTGGAGIITINFSGSVTLSAGLLTEITGCITSGTITDQAPVGNSDAHNDTTPYVSTTTGTTAQADEVVMAATHFYTNTGSYSYAWGNGYSALDQQTNSAAWTAATAFKLLTSTGTQQSSVTSTGAGTDDGLTFITTFKTQSGGGGGSTSLDWMNSGPRRKGGEDVRLRVVSAPDAQAPQQLPPYIDSSASPPRGMARSINRPAYQFWTLAAIVPVVISSFAEFAPTPARASRLTTIRPFDAGQALKPLQPFPAGGWLPDATLPRDAQIFNPNKQPTPPDGAATLAPVQPFPSQRYLPTADLPVDARPTPAGVRPLPPDQGYLLPLPTALLAAFDAAPAPARPEIVTTKQPAVADGSTLAPLQPFPSQSYLPTADLPIDGRVPGPKKPAAPDGSALAPLQQFPSTTYLPTADLPVDGRVSGPKQPAVPDGSALSPLQPFPAAAYLSTADLPVVGKVPGPKQPASPDGSALAPLQPFPAGGWLPESSPITRAASPTLRRVSNDAPPPALVVATLLPWFDPTPPPLHRETTTKQPPAPDPAILTRLPFVVSAWADFAPPPVSKPTKTRGAFSADPSILAALPVPVLSAWSEFSPRPIASKQNATTRPADAGQALSPLPFVPGWQPPVELPARAAPTTQGRSFDSGQALKPLQPFPVAADFDLAPAPAKAPTTTARAAVAVETPPPALATTLPVFFDLSPQPQRGRMPGDPPLPQPWFLAPLAGPAPSAWGDFAPAPVRGTLFAVRAPAAPVWNLPGFASVVFVPFIDSSEVVFNPTFATSIVVPFIPSTTVVPPPSFQNALLPPFLSSTGGVFAPEVLRRPDQVAELLSGGTSTITHEGSNGKLYLIPLDQIDARQRALRVLRRFISLLTFRREVAPGEEDGRAFRIGVEQILLESPKDAGGEANLPTVAFLPGSGVTNTLGIGGINILDDTLGVEGDGTAVAKYGEYSEQITIEIVAASPATRNGLVAGLKQAFRTQLEWNTLVLNIPEYFGNIVEFNLDAVEYIEEAYADQNRRRAQLKVTLVVPELFVVRGFPLLDPRVLLELGAELVIETQVDVDET